MPSDLRVADWRARARYAASLAAIGIAYFGLAKFGLMLASINPSATPVWPPTGFALAAVLLWGYRVWPAVFVAAFAINVMTAGSVGTSIAIAIGNTLECLVTGLLINRWSHGKSTFETPMGVVRFAALSLSPGPLLSATIGVGSLALAGFADWSNFNSIWITWWLGDATGALVITPVIVLWATAPARAFRRDQLLQSGLVVLTTMAIGVLAFSPLFEQTGARGPLSFLAILPLILAAMYRGQRDTALAALLLSGFAVWGTLMNGGPFARDALNDSFLMLLAFIISTSVPSLVLSADAAMRKRAERRLSAAHQELNQRVSQRTSELERAIEALQSEVEERRDIEAELREQRVHLVEAQRLANLGSWVWDIRRNTLNWSEQIFQIYGVGPADFHGTYDDFIGRIHPDDREIVHDAITTALRSGKAFQISERIVRPNGEVRHLQSVGEVIRDERGEAARMLGICLDITDRKIAENALRESEERYRLLVDGVHDYAILMLDPDGRLMSWNAGAARITQYGEDEILGSHFSRFYTDEERANGEPERALRLAATGKYECESWRVRKDGSRFWASVVIDSIRAADGSLVGFAKLTRDITERRETQAALEDAREKLAQAQKLEALGQLTGGIAHDFNNLLMIVSGHAQQLRRLVTDQKQLRAIDAIDTATSRGENLTRHLLAFSRNQQLSPAVVDLKARVEAMRGMLTSSLRGNIELNCDIPHGIWPTEVDISEFELALVNVAVNARDAMPDGGRFTLSARNVSLMPGQSPGGLEGDFVELSMTDTGIGFPRNALAKAFEPFFTTKAVGKGTGLGLSQVHGFAHQSGGTVTIASEVGHGTTIAIYLPRSHAPITSMAQSTQPQPSANGNGTVLVVEDNPEVADVTAALLVQLGYRVAHATQATEALSRLEQGDIDLVFSDIVMPGPMDGVALAGAIKAQFPLVPVILTTGYTEITPETASELLILRKPFQLVALQKAVHEALQRACQDNPAKATG